LQNACEKPSRKREPSTSPKLEAAACHSMASDQSTPEVGSRVRASALSTARPARNEANEKTAAKPRDANSPYCAWSKPSSTFMKARDASATAAAGWPARSVKSTR